MNEFFEEDKQSPGYGAGVILGTVLGGASLFLLGTKTGQKIVEQLKKESISGDLNFKEIEISVNQKMKDFLATVPLNEYLKNIFPTHKKAAPKVDTKDKRNFFFKKGKKLGK